MEKRMFYLGKVKKKIFDKDFDGTYDKFKNKAIDKGYGDKEIAILNEKAYARFYVIIDLEVE